MEKENEPVDKGTTVGKDIRVAEGQEKRQSKKRPMGMLTEEEPPTKKKKGKQNQIYDYHIRAALPKADRTERGIQNLHKKKLETFFKVMKIKNGLIETVLLAHIELCERCNYKFCMCVARWKLSAFWCWPTNLPRLNPCRSWLVCIDNKDDHWLC